MDKMRIPLKFAIITLLLIVPAISFPAFGLLYSGQDTTLDFNKGESLKQDFFEVNSDTQLTGMTFKVTLQNPTALSGTTFDLETVINRSSDDMTGLKEADIIKFDSEGRPWIIDWDHAVITRASDSELSELKRVTIEGVDWRQGIAGIAITPDNNDAWILVMPSKRLVLVDGSTLKAKLDVELADEVATIEGGIETDSSGNAWMSDYQNGSLLQVTKTGAKNRFPLPDGIIHPRNVLVDDSNLVWFVADKVTNMTSQNGTYEVYWGSVLESLDPATRSFAQGADYVDKNNANVLIDHLKNTLLYINPDEGMFGTIDTETHESHEFRIQALPQELSSCEIGITDAKLGTDGLIWYVLERSNYNLESLPDECMTVSGIIRVVKQDGTLLSEKYESDQFDVIKTIGVDGLNDKVLLGGSESFISIDVPAAGDENAAYTADVKIGLPQLGNGLGLTFFERSGINFETPIPVSVGQDAISSINSYIHEKCKTGPCSVVLGFSASNVGSILVSDLRIEGNNLVQASETIPTPGDELPIEAPVEIVKDENCNNNRLCEPDLGEDTDTCPRDCISQTTAGNGTVAAGLTDVAADSTKQAANKILIIFLLVTAVVVTVIVAVVSSKRRKEEQR